MNDPAVPNDGVNPSATIVTARRWRVSPVWILPALAILVGGWLGTQAWLSQGPTITVRFKSADGLEAGKTKLRYRNVEIGTVDSIHIADADEGIVVKAKMSRESKRMLVDDTRFWVARPRVANGQISGLSTVLSGAFIGVDVGHSKTDRVDFIGLERQPPIMRDERGREVTLHAKDSHALDVGSPVFNRRIQVGEVTAVELDADHRGVTVHAFIRAPDDAQITKGTRFWQAGGIDVSVGSEGLKVSTQSLVSIRVGGIAFGLPDSGEARGEVEPNTRFNLYDDERSAMKRSEEQIYKFIAYFDKSIEGLSVSAPVKFRGLIVGEVRSMDVQFDKKSQDFRFPVEIAIYRDLLPQRIEQASPGFNLDEGLEDAIRRRGLRAQLRNGNLLTGQMFVAVDFFKNATPIGDQPLRAADQLIIPTEPGSLEVLQDTVARIAQNLEKIPFGALANDVRQTLQQVQRTFAGADRLVGKVNDDVAPELLATLTTAKITMKNAGDTLASDSPTQTELRQALIELRRTAESLRGLTDYLQLHPESLLRGKGKEASSESNSLPEASRAP